MNILLLTRAYSEAGGGMERLSWELTHELQKQPDLQVQVIVPTGVLSHRQSALFALAIIPRALVSAHNADVVHIGDPVLSLAGWLIAKLLRKPVAVTVHGLDVSYANPLYKLYSQLFFRHFAAYIAISNYAKQQLEKWHVSGQVIVISPGIHDRLYQTPGVQHQVLNRLTLFTVGRLVKRKGHAWFVEHVLPHLPNVEYIIAGMGPEDMNIIQAAENAKVAERVKLLGRVDDEKLRELYNTTDAFIQPSIKVEGDAEGFGLVMLEAALCEQPVFAANVDGIPDAIHQDKNGYLLPSGDAGAWIRALQDFLAHREKYQQQAKLARQYSIDNFGWEKVGKRYAVTLTGLAKFVR